MMALREQRGCLRHPERSTRDMLNDSTVNTAQLLLHVEMGFSMPLTLHRLMFSAIEDVGEKETKARWGNLKNLVFFIFKFLMKVY
jgi:hypothetical protein